MALLSASHQLRQASRCLYASLVGVIFRPVWTTPHFYYHLSFLIKLKTFWQSYMYFIHIDAFNRRYHVDEKHSNNESEYASRSAETHSHSKPRQLKST